MRRSLLALLLVSATLAAQEKRPGEVVTTIDVDVLTLDVLVLDKKGKPVFDLKPSELEVKVAGKVQPFEGFEPPRGPAVGADGDPTPDRALDARDVHPSHLLLFFDLEDLPASGLVEATEAAAKWAAAPAGQRRLGLASYLGHAGIHLWDDPSSNRLEAELSRLREAMPVVEVTNEAWASRENRDTGPRPAPRTWDARRRHELWLVEQIVRAEQDEGGGLLAALYREFGDYLRAERDRVRELIRELKALAERFASLPGARHLVLVTKGLERVPGLNAVEFLKSARSSRRATAGERPLRDPLGTFSSASGQFPFNPSPIPELPELERYLATSGILVHYVAPGLGDDLPSAEHGLTELKRDMTGDLQMLRAGIEPIVDATGGLSRPHGAGSLGTLLDGTTSTYRVAVRLTGVKIGRNYKVQVSARRPGVSATARSAYVPQTAAARVPALATVAAAAAAESRRDERREGALREVSKPLPVVVRWKGKAAAGVKAPDGAGNAADAAGVKAPDGAGGAAAAAGVQYTFEVAVPNDALRFNPAGEAMVASCLIVVEARSLDSAARERFSEDVFLALTGEEYSAASGKEMVKALTLALMPGRWELSVTVNDALEGSYGTAVERVVAEP